MLENEASEKRNIETEGGNYNERIEGGYFQVDNIFFVTHSKTKENPTSAPLPSTFPIRKSQEDRIGAVSGWHMNTNITLFENGLLYGITRTWTNNDGFGFHGSVTVVLVDENEHHLWMSRPRIYGVSPKTPAKLGRFLGLPVKSDRTDDWKEEEIPQEILRQVRAFLIIHEHAPGA